MNTFVPYADAADSARVLDRSRLGKQRVEVLQLLRAMTGVTKGWRNHPAARMWAGHEGALVTYGLAICREWTARGYRDSCADKIQAVATPDDHWPSWWGDDAVHLSHRSNLVRKNATHYGPLWPDVPTDLPYVWPTNQTPMQIILKNGAEKL